LKDLVKSPDGYTLSEAHAQGGRMELLQKMAEKRLVQGPPWHFTEHGKTMLVAAQEIRDPKSSFVCTDDLTSDATTTYQLIMELRRRGWSHEGVDRCRAKELKTEPYTYAADEANIAKVWYTRLGEATVCHQYLLSLLRAADHGQCVHHFLRVSDYEALLNPTDVPAVRKARRMMVITVADEHGWPEDPLPARKPRQRAPRRRTTPAIADQDVHLESDNDPDHGDDAGDDNADGNSDELSSDDKSDDEKTSDSSDSSDSSDDDNNSDLFRMSANEPASSSAGPVPDVPPDVPPDVLETYTRRYDMVQKWGIINLTPKFTADGTLLSWQIRCKHPLHANCTKTRNVLTDASEEVTLRMLKKWALDALEPDILTKDLHRALWNDVVTSSMDSNLPSSEFLDACAIQSIDAYTVT
jgi:hypothetical protein